jgi:ADP-ribosylglycohydrolase
MGVACGDAMGMPTSMYNPETVRLHFPDGIHDFQPAPATHPIHSGLVAGQVTDDTQQTLAIADAILECGCVDSVAIMRKLLAWAESMDAFSSSLLGPSSLKALQLFKAGAPLETTGKYGDTNGASMRISPVGIINYGDISRTVDDVARACLPTHNTDIAIAGASAIACAIGRCIAGERSLDSVFSAAVQGAELGITKGNSWIGASIPRRVRLAFDIVVTAGSEQTILRNLYDIVGATVTITETVPTCLALVKYANGDPLKTILFAANMGGDADTIGAIAGSIAGAYAGIDAFPIEYRRRIEEVNHCELERHALQLADFIIARA